MLVPPPNEMLISCKRGLDGLGSAALHRRPLRASKTQPAFVGGISGLGDTLAIEARRFTSRTTQGGWHRAKCG